MLRTLLVCGLLFAIVGCDSSSSDILPPPAPLAALIPLDVGNVWIMDFEKILVETGEVQETRIDTFRIAADTLIGNENWVRVEHSHVEGRSGLPSFLALRDDDIWGWYDPAIPESVPFLIYQYPAEAGTTYPYSPGFCRATSTVVDAEASITTQAGTFSAYQFDIKFDSLYLPSRDALPSIGNPDIEFIAPGVGPIQVASAYYRIRDDQAERYRTLNWSLREMIPAEEE